jgi:hypothetical protein
MNHVRTLSPFVYQLRQALWWVLQVPVHRHYRVATGVMEPSGQSRLVSEATGEADHLHFRKDSSQSFNALESVVSAPVVYEKDLVPYTGSGQRFVCPPHELIDTSRLVQNWDNKGDERILWPFPSTHGESRSTSPADLSQRSGC